MTENKRDSMVFYRSFYEALLKLPVKKREATTRAIFEYAFNGVEPDNLDPMGNMVFTVAKPLIDISNNRYNNCVNNGKKGGRPRKQALSDASEDSENKNPLVLENKNQEVSENNNQEVSENNNQRVSNQKNLNDNDNDNVNDNVNVNEHVNVNASCLPYGRESELTHGKGEYNNIFLTATETAKLINMLGFDRYEKSLEFLSGYLARKPDHKSACHYEDIRGWVQKALVDRGIVPLKEDEEKSERLKKAGFDFEFEDIFENP